MVRIHDLVYIFDKMNHLYQIGTTNFLVRSQVLNKRAGLTICQQAPSNLFTLLWPGITAIRATCSISDDKNETQVTPACQKERKK